MVSDAMTPPTETPQAPAMLRALCAGSAAAWGIATAAVLLTAGLVQPALVESAAFGCGAALLGVAAGLAGVVPAIRLAVDPGFAVVGGSIFRATAGVLAGLLIRSAADATPRPFWLAFLVVIAAVMAAEVAVSWRLLNLSPASKERPRP